MLRHLKTDFRQVIPEILTDIHEMLLKTIIKWSIAACSLVAAIQMLLLESTMATSCVIRKLLSYLILFLTISRLCSYYTVLHFATLHEGPTKHACKCTNMWLPWICGISLYGRSIYRTSVAIFIRWPSQYR